MAKLGTFMDDAEADVLAYMAFPAQPRYMQVEAMAGLNPPTSEERKLLQNKPKAA